TLNAPTAAVTGTFRATSSLAVSPSTAAKAVGQSQGFTANGTFTDGVSEAIRAGQGTWTTKAAMTTTRSSVGAAAAGGKLYAIGGVTSGPLTVVEVYNPATDTWAAAAPISVARNLACAVTVNGLVYAIS